MRKPDEKDLRALYEQLGSPVGWLKALENAMAEDQPHFTMRYVMLLHDDNKLRYDVDFFKLDGENSYTLERYKAVLHAPIPIPDVTIKGVNTKELEAKMTPISWDDFRKDGTMAVISEKRRLKLDAQVKEIQSDLQVLRRTEEGLKIVRLLEAKFFSNAPFVAKTSLQKNYDRIEEQHGVAHLFKMTNGNGPTFGQSYKMLKGEMPLPTEPYQSNIYRVHIAGVALSTPENGTDMRGLVNNESHYFRTMGKAFTFANSLDDRYYFPRLVLQQGLDRAIRKTTIAEEFTQEIFASKQVLSDPAQAPGQAVLGWEINEKKIGVAEFERQTSYSLQALDKHEHCENKFIVAREREFMASSPQRQPKKTTGIKKRNGKHLK